MKTLLRLICSFLLLAGATSAPAAIDLVGHDTDLFTTNPNIPSQIPSVLIVLDNTANWSANDQGWETLSDLNDPVCKASEGWQGSAQGDSELCAIYKAIANVDEQVNVGLMLTNDTDGGYIRFPMKQMNTTNKDALKLLIKNINTVGQGINRNEEKGPASAAFSNVMNDAFRYFNGFQTYAAQLSPAKDSDAYADASAYADTGKTVFKFGGDKSNACGYAYIIFISNGSGKAEVLSELQTAADLLDDNITANQAVLQSTGVNVDVWSRFLFQYGIKIKAGVYRHVTTYTLDVCKDKCNQTQAVANATMLKSAAAVSQGKYFRTTDTTSISTALATIFAEVQAVNSVFAATTLPVSINVRGTNLNQVYIGVFRPDSTLSPRWQGNLKQYKLGVIDTATSQLGLVDATNTNAVNLNTGFISNTATSFWTESTTAGSGFWAFRGTYPQTDVGKDQDSPDGDLVEKGGAAQKLRQVYANPDADADQTRKIYTCTACSAGDTNALCSATACTAGATLKNYPFNVANGDITAGLLGTFASSSVTSLTGSGSTARATISGGHTFSVGNLVIIAGATPTAYNSTNSPVGAWTITAKDSASPSTWFEYSIASGTTTSFDTTNAYATYPGYKLIPGTDTVTVSATPSTYNVTDRAILGVPGNINQFSYLLPGTTYPTTVASSYTVTANRRVTSLTYSAATGRITAVVPYHPYTASSTGLSITGAGDGAFNNTNITSIADIANAGTASSSFTYAALSTPSGGSVTTAVATVDGTLPSGALTGAERFVICNGTPTITGVLASLTCPTASGFNTSGTGATITTVTAGPANPSWRYTFGGAPSAPGGGTSGGTGFTATRIVTNDQNNYTFNLGAQTGATSPVTAANPNVLTLAITYNASGVNQVTGQNARQLAIGSVIEVTGVTCFKSNNTQQPCSNGNSTAHSATTAYNVTLTDVTWPGTFPGTVTVKWRTNNNQTDKINITAGATFVWKASSNGSAPTFSTPVSLGTTGPLADSATVVATGTITSKLTGDLASGGVGLVTSLTSQAVATGTITAALNTSADTNERANLINWVRGQDNKDNENQNSVSTDIRASIHGDVLHSRPAVINYNRDSTPTATDDNDVYVFYGANDGLLHAIKGGSIATGGGKEVWAYAAPEFFSRFKRLRDQSPSISSSNPRDYFFDGPIGVYTLDADRNGALEAGGDDKVHMFVGMRRGGRFLYALDITDPEDPKLLWKKGCPNATGTTGCDTGWSEIGQTWSQPQLGYLRNWPDKLVIIMAAGYDAPIEDLQPCFVSDWYDKSVTTSPQVVAKTGAVVPTPMDVTNCNAKLADGSLLTVRKDRTMGRGIFIIDAANGDVLYRIGPDAAAILAGKQVAEMEFAMPGDLAVLRNRDNAGGRATDIGTESVAAGYLDRIYATDTGGNVWRIDVSAVSADPAVLPPFVVSRLASLSSTSYTLGNHPVQNYRKIMFSPDVVYTTETDGSKYDAVLVGSGDREHPFDMTVNNRFYMIKDKNISSLVTADVNIVSTDMKVKWAAPTTGVVTDTRPQVGITTDTATAVDLYDVTNNCLQSVSLCNTGSFASTGQTQTTAKADLKAAKGWKLLYPNTGEKTVATPTTAAGTVIFNTNQPKQDTVSGQTADFCTSDLGTARQYGINYLDATANNIFSSLPTQYVEAGGRDAMFAGGGFLPTPVPVVVQIDGKYYQTVIAGVQTTNPGGLKFQSRLRTYWYRKTD